MSWDTLKANQWVSREDLQQAVDEGFFLVNAGVPATDPTKLTDSAEADAWVKLDATKLPTNPLQWVVKQQLVGVFPVIVTEFTNLASPSELVYNTNNGLIYFIDYDNNNFGVWYFDPKTAQGIQDFVGIAGTNKAGATDNSMRFVSMVFSPDQNKIYCQGDESGGMVIIDCATNTVSNTIAYGIDGQFERQNMYIIGDNVWAYDLNIMSFQVVSMATETIIGTFNITSIPGYTDFGSASIAIAGGNIWICLTSSATYGSRIRVYQNTAGIPNYTTDLLHSIDNIGVTPSSNSKIQVSPIYCDTPKNVVYAWSSGDGAIYTFDAVTYAAKSTITIPKEGKTYAGGNMVFRTTTNQLYATGRLYNGTSDNGLDRTYNIDRDNQTILNTLDGVNYSNFVYASSTQLNYSAQEKLTYYSVPNTGYLTDGIIQGFN